MQSTIRTAVLSILLLAPVLSFAQIPAQPADTLTIDELVFVGFAQQKKVNLTGSISQVDMEAVLGDRPLISLSAAMQGAVPGLTVSGGSSPGQPKNFNIRGTLSLNGGSPLVLIDNTQGDLNSLNPDDIASVTVLKDAASAAIYGARAAGGVILITTKHPLANQPVKLEYGFNLGFERSIGRPRQASLDDYIAAYREAGFSSQYWAGNGQLPRWEELLGQYRGGTLRGVYDNGIFRDEDGAVYFLKEGDVLGNALESGVLKNHSLSVSGGAGNVRYRLSGSISHDDGPMVGSKDTYSRKSLSAFI
ncbi:MAG: TonB-dependent receptor plug domain-containing protein, partial [Bacteroidales bacterium]|nr:TonB-dependent receptor plug domain-containing protein [Bacteroidales bacterium]